MRSGDGLKIVLGIPIRVDHDDRRSLRQVDTQPASFG
jgi:hypothetical protein